MISSRLRPHWPLFLLLFLTAAAYSVGVDSRFLLDDFPNLMSLEDVPKNGYLHYIFTNSSGPSGRPVSVLSFAFQYQDWPDNPLAFKAVNVCIHLLNGVFIYLISQILFRFIGSVDTSARLFALLVTALWLIHPIHVNTVLYVVQRMAMLTTLFTLAGIYVYLKLWDLDQTSVNIKRILGFSVIFFACMVLAIFSKENGILLPLFIVCIEFTLLAKVKRPAQWRLWSIIFLMAPLVVTVIYLGMGFNTAIENYSIRSYNMLERLMTEARIMFIYLKHLIIPHPSAFSLFHDNFMVSRGLLSPPSTLFSIVALGIGLLISMIWRKKYPVIAFAIFWFLSAHLLESTYLNLELYFEHRNYLASLGIIVLIIWCFLKARLIFTNARVPEGLVAAIFIAMGTVTWSEITLWSNPIEQSLEWQRRSPQSARAITEVAYLYQKQGNYDEALSTFDQIKTFYPDEIFPDLKRLYINTCERQQTYTQAEWQSLFQKASVAKWYGGAPVMELDAMAEKIRTDDCPDLNIYALIRLVLLLTVNPEFSRYRPELHVIAAALNGYIGEIDAAINNADQAIKEEPSPQRYFLKLKLLMYAGRNEEAANTFEEIKQRYKGNVSFHLAFGDYVSYYEKRLSQTD